MAQTEDAIETPALGRPFQLGMLYDCRKDALIPGVTLWDYSSLQKDLTIKPQPKTESEIIASDSIDDKASTLDISASLKASFLGGLVEVGGSAKYLHDTKQSKQQARVTVQYKTTTKYEQLTMSHLGIQNVSYPAVFEHGTATHVVTAILYGAQAFFVFDREVSSTETVKHIQGSLQLTVQKLISITGEAEVKLTEKEKENALKFSCKFHGDFSLEKNPVTFQDAMKVYETLPKLLGEHGEKAVPMRVWLYPLTKLDTRAAKMVREISLALIFDAEKILEELNEIRMQSNDLAKNPIAETFPEIKRKIQQFKDLCKQHRQTFQKQLARMLPSIRGGGQEEGILVDILMSINQSPFNSQRLRGFLDSKKREINFVKSYLTILNEMQVISSQNKLEEIVLDLQNVYVVSFIFTSLYKNEPFLLSLQDWLGEQFLQESAKSTRSSSGQEEDTAWFDDKGWTRNARQAAKSIKDYFSINQSNEKVCYVVASLPDLATPGASIYLYEDGRLVSQNFELPSKPLPFLISELRHDSIQLKFQPAEYGKASISNYLVEYKVAGDENWKTVRTEDTREMFLLKDLPPNTEYQFQYAACCKPGLSKSSDLSPPIKTLPTSPPEKLRMVTAAPSVISVAWMSPSIVASGVMVKEYKVEYRMVEAGIGSVQWTEKRTGRKTEFYPIEGLKPQTVYKIRVSAMCDNGALGVPSKEMEVSTSLEEGSIDNVARQFLQESSLVEDRQPLMFTLPLKKVPSDSSRSCFMYQVGKENPEVPNKVILVMGATGCGKTTLINGMINYIVGVQWEDNFRFKLIHETTQRSEAGRRTSEVTAFVVNHRKGFQIPFSLTIIDTPGFGGTRDAEQDKLVEKQLLEFFSTPGGIDHMDAICLVAQAFLAHSTHIQKCVFDSMLSMLGKDVKENIQLLITFADGGTPPVLEALKETDLPCTQNESGIPLHFRLNHSALFAPREYGGSPNIVAEMFWKMSTESMKNLFDSLVMLETKSLTLTMEVLKEHQELEAALRRPPPPKVEQVHPNSFHISIDPAAIGKASVSRYQVEYRIAGDNWKSLNTEGPKDQFTLEDVHLNLQYQFRCAAVTPGGLSQWSEAITCICPTGRPAEKSRVLCCATCLEIPGSIRGPERRIILMGKSGNGKSATGNTILGSKVCEFGSATKTCQKEETWLKGRKIVVLDTPGFVDTPGFWNPVFYSNYMINGITKFVSLYSLGPHVILWVIRLGSFTRQRLVAEQFKNIFSLKGKNYTIVLFTHKEELKGRALEEFISEEDPSLRSEMSHYGNRFLAFNNEAEGEEREAQVAQLMTMIDDLVQKNKDAPCYTEEMLTVSRRVSDTQEPRMAQREDAIETPALGRPFQLGMLYDCHKDALIPGVTLWDYSSLQKDLTIKPQPKTESEIIVSDSIDDKASALDISASLKASFLGGLVEVGGSAKYLHDTKKSKQQARVTVQYKTTTKYEQLTMSHLGIQNVSYPAVFEQGTATHVVTAILYGAQAFFVFDREVSSTETVKHIQGSLQLTVQKLISITGEAEIKLTEKEKENALKFSCKFHGDFSLEKNPVTLQDAITAYETLPKLLGEHGENAVPMRVWLYPLTKLDTRAAKIVREISLMLIFDAEKILEELNEIQMQSNDLAKNPIAETFPEIKRKIQQFKDLCKQHRQIFQKQLARMLPSIRGGRKEEGTLGDILISIKESPFNGQRLCEFLDSKKREINFIKSYLTILNNIEVISSQNKLEEIVLDPQNVYVVSFIFTSLHKKEPFLLSLQKWLQEQFSQESAKSTKSGQEEDTAWFEDKERTRNARRAAKSIKDFFSINQSNEKVRIVVASLPDLATPGASMYLYEDGELVSKNFELPSKPLPFLITELRHDSIQLKFQPAEYGKSTITNYLVEYKIAGEENWKTVRTEDTREMFLLKDLLPNTEYRFQYAACCKPGLTISSVLSPPIKTLPTSPPEKLRMVTAAPSVISVAWMSPSIIASGVVVIEYKLEYRMVEVEYGNDQWIEKRTGNKTEFYSIEGLRPQTAYRIRVSAVCDNGVLSVPSKEMKVSTILEKESADKVAHQFLQKSYLVEDKQPLVFALHLEKISSDASTSCLGYQLGKKNPEVPNKVILIMGATGCGKTTLINGMINYILGVQCRDNFRFKLIHETTQKSGAGSRTSEVTAYVVNHQKGFRIPYSLTIIDTPVFGGTRDAEQDKLVEKQLLEFFSTPGGIDHVDAICLVAQAFLAHSIHAQKCIFDSMLSMLGKDVKDNIQLLISFADEGTPPVLEALREADLSCAQNDLGTPLHFKFNHSALFVNQENGRSHNAAGEMFWKMSTESMKDFFDWLKILETKSLTLTMEVLKKRQELEAALRRPPPPKIEQVHPNSFQISIAPVAIGKPSVSRYQVEYRITGDNWKSLDAKNPKDQFTLEDVHLNLQYQFRCAAVTPVGLSQWSEAITCICPTGRPAEKSRVLCCATCLEMAGSIRGPERRIVLVGKWGNGKSATGNTILGSKIFAFGLSSRSVTQTCQKEETQMKGRKVVVVDTPGFFHTYRPDKDTAAEVSKCVKFCCPGPHVILHVADPLRFSQEETDVAQQVKEIFGLKAKDYTILLFTCKDGLEGRSLENFISSRDKKVKEYIAECGNRCLAFNNEAEGVEREAQVAEMMTMIDDLVEKNRYAPCYTEDMMKVNKRHDFRLPPFPSGTRKSL
ncbi:uncharacterized protein LOC117657948 [Pantherophis guttatus]|uniref:Uncharacterized protein LOC117657948 n=1 Tax=Pantherophis guttatus TaxID=94885 RepID=A0ABM3YSU9_PANGU|nr:uncharacterized protein LOC117657948 [Pantherophis guttatus]